MQWRPTVGLPNQPDRIALNPGDFMNDIVTGFARLQQQVARAAVLGQADEIDRDRIADMRRDDREASEQERAE